jgi:hypothetical protein
MVGLALSLSLLGIVGGLTVWAILDDRRASRDAVEAWDRITERLREQRRQSR